MVESPDSTLQGVARLELPGGWSASPKEAPVRLAGAGTQQEVSFTVTPPPGGAIGAATVGAEVEVRGTPLSYGLTRISASSTVTRSPEMLNGHGPIRPLSASSRVSYCTTSRPPRST